MREHRTKDDVIKLLRQAYRKKGEPLTIDQFQHYARVSNTTLYKLFGNWGALVKAAGLEEAFGNKPDDSALEHDVGQGLKLNAEEMKQEIKRLRIQLEESPKARLDAKKVRNEIFKLAEYDPSPPKWTLPPATHSNNPVVPMFIWSDFHWGEVVRAEEINGVNEYSLSIANRRFKTLVSREIDICRQHAKLFKYPGAVVCLGGDMVSGDIHEELSKTNEKPMMAVVSDLIDALMAGLQAFADYFGSVYVPCVPGNHARTSKKPEAKRAHWTSFDWLIYLRLAKQFQLLGDKRVRFNIPDAPDAYFKIYGHRYLLTHGDKLGAKGGDGFIGALGPIMRGHKKKAGQQQQIGRTYDTILMGHYHWYFPTLQIIVNDTLKGYDEYAYANGFDPAPAGQAMWFHHPKYGIFNTMKVYVEEGERRGTGWLEAA